MTHVPGHWREERLRRMSSRDWQDGYEISEHPAEACTDTHESCVVARTMARTKIRRNATSGSMHVLENSYVAQRTSRDNV